MSGRRWLKFWPQDWQRDPALRSCGVAARGLWMDMLCIAHDATPYGHVAINGKSATPKQIGSVTGTPERDVMKLLAELEDAGVFSRTAGGMIFSRRMVRDAVASEAGRKAIEKRWGNGADDDAEEPSPPTRETPRKPIRGPCSPEAEAEAEAEADSPKPPPRPSAGSAVERDADPAFQAFWAAYPRRDDKGHAWTAWRKALKKADSATIMVGLAAATFDSRRRFIPLPATWLNGERWADEAPSLPLANGSEPPGDPVVAWIAGHPEVTMEPDSAGVVVPSINGFSLPAVINRVLDASGLPVAKARDLDVLARWLADELPLRRDWTAPIARQAARMRDQGQPIGGLAVFDAAVRG